MSLTAPPKQKAHHKKRQALHHRRSKHYMKPYSPYLPMLGIVGLGYLANASMGWLGIDGTGSASIASSRLAVITGNVSLVYAVLATTFAAFAVFVLAHWYRFHRLLNRGEAFAASHPWIDVSLVSLVTVGFLLTRR